MDFEKWWASAYSLQHMQGMSTTAFPRHLSRGHECYNVAVLDLLHVIQSIREATYAPNLPSMWVLVPETVNHRLASAPSHIVRAAGLQATREPAASSDSTSTSTRHVLIQATTCSCNFPWAKTDEPLMSQNNLTNNPSRYADKVLF